MKQARRAPLDSVKQCKRVKRTYSWRRASIGSMRVALHAGTRQAPQATSNTNTATAMNVMGSTGFTPKSQPLMSLVTRNAPIKPAKSPPSTARMPSERISTRIRRRLEPMARRYLWNDVSLRASIDYVSNGQDEAMVCYSGDGQSSGQSVIGANAQCHLLKSIRCPSIPWSLTLPAPFQQPSASLSVRSPGGSTRRAIVG